MLASGCWQCPENALKIQGRTPSICFRSHAPWDILDRWGWHRQTKRQVLMLTKKLAPHFPHQSVMMHGDSEAQLLALLSCGCMNGCNIQWPRALGDWTRSRYPLLRLNCWHSMNVICTGQLRALERYSMASSSSPGWLHRERSLIWSAVCRNLCTV